MNSEEALDHIARLDVALQGDVDYWVKQFNDGNQSQLARRSFVRALFALIEGMTFSIKRLVLMFAADGDGKLTPDEISLLSEHTAELDSAGAIIGKTAYLKFKPNLQFTFRKFSEITKSGFKLDVSNDGWEKLARSLKIRDRLMHPKSALEVDVTDGELCATRAAADWFAKTYAELWERAITAISEENKAKKVELDKLEARTKELEAKLQRPGPN